MNILDLLVGKPLATSDERAEQVGPTQGIPIFGLDGLSSAAYGPEAALSLLIPLGLAGLNYKLTPEIVAIHIEPNEHSELLRDEWDRYVNQPFQQAGATPPKLLTLPSPYRFIIIPIVQYVLELSEKHPDRRIIVVIPKLVEGRWYEYFLHNQRGRLLEWVLLARGHERIFTVSAPYYLGHNP